jgi:hypothetical protein
MGVPMQLKSDIIMLADMHALALAEATGELNDTKLSLTIKQGQVDELSSRVAELENKNKQPQFALDLHRRIVSGIRADTSKLNAAYDGAAKSHGGSMGGACSNRNKAKADAHDKAKATTQQWTNTDNWKVDSSDSAELSSSRATLLCRSAS